MLDVFIVRIVLVTLVLWLIATLGAKWLVVDEPVAHADALLVLAGATVYEERLQYAADLFREQRAQKILLTNDGQKGSWSRELQRNPTSVELAVGALEKQGIPSQMIEILPGIVRGTSDEAFAVRRYVRVHPTRSLIAVTSPYHTRRTAWTLRHLLEGEGVAVGIDPVPPTATTPKAATWWATPNGWRTVATEFVKLPYYWFRYGFILSGED